MILVTGATSQLGEILVQKLSKSNQEVICFVRKTSNTQNLKLENVKLVYGDYKNMDSIRNSLKDVEYLIHIGGIWYEHDFLEILEKNDKFKKAVFVGSTSVFQKINSKDPHEQELVRKMKMAENEINESKLDTVIIRPTMLYGRDKDKNVLILINFMNKFHFFPIIGSGSGKKQPVYVGDVADAIISVLFNEKIKKEEYNIPGEEPILYKEMINEIKKNLNKPVFVFHIPLVMAKLGFKIFKKIKKDTTVNEEMVNRVNEDFVFDFEKAKNDFNFKPLPFKQGVKRQIEYLRDKGKLQ